jgi:DNA-binding LacI/PurR family transcriptional regulator
LARGNVGLGDRLRPRPTSLVIPTFRMGELAAEMLIDEIEKPNGKSQRVLLPFELAPGTTA